MAFREQLSFQLAGSLLRFANTKRKHLQTTLAYGLMCTHKVVVGLQLRNIQAEILSTASYTHWALFLAVCSWSLLGSRYVCRQLPHGLIADIKSSQSKLFFFFFFHFAVCLHFSLRIGLLENEEGNKRPRGVITFTFPGVNISRWECGDWGLFAFCLCPPFCPRVAILPSFSICSICSCPCSEDGMLLTSQRYCKAQLVVGKTFPDL